MGMNMEDRWAGLFNRLWTNPSVGLICNLLLVQESYPGLVEGWFSYNNAPSDKLLSLSLSSWVRGHQHSLLSREKQEMRVKHPLDRLMRGER